MYRRIIANHYEEHAEQKACLYVIVSLDLQVLVMLKQ